MIPQCVDCEKLIAAIENTFRNRQTDLPASFADTAGAIDTTVLSLGWRRVQICGVKVDFEQAWQRLLKCAQISRPVTARNTSFSSCQGGRSRCESPPRMIRPGHPVGRPWTPRATSRSSPRGAFSRSPQDAALGPTVAVPLRHGHLRIRPAPTGKYTPLRNCPRQRRDVLRRVRN